MIYQLTIKGGNLCQLGWKIALKFLFDTKINQHCMILPDYKNFFM